MTAATATMTAPAEPRHWRDVTGPWRRLRDGLFQTRDGRFRALYSEELACWWLIERTDDGEHWQDTFPRLGRLRQHVAGVLEREELHADSFHLEHRQTRAGIRSVRVMKAGEVHATVTIGSDSSLTLRGGRVPMQPELAEAVSLALAEAAMTARALEATEREEAA